MIRWFVISLLLFHAHSAIAERVPGSDFSYGNWDGGAYTDDTTGEFTHCAIAAGYASGNTLFFSVNKDASITVAVGGELGLNQGQQFPVALYVDRRRPFYGTAYATSPDFALLTISDFAAAMTAFQKGYVLRIEALGGITEYSLEGTFRALERARQCALRHFDYVSAPKIRDKTPMYQLSTMIISELGLDDFRYLTEGELRELGWEAAVAWTSERYGVTGFSLIMPVAQGLDLRSTDAGDTEFIARGCKGDYATSARSINLEDASSARELRLICTTGDNITEHYLSKFLSDSQVVYTLLVFEESGAELPEDVPRAAQSESATVRAAKFMSE